MSFKDNSAHVLRELRMRNRRIRSRGAEIFVEEVVAVMEESEPSGARRAGHTHSADGEAPAILSEEYAKAWHTEEGPDGTARAVNDHLAEEGGSLAVMLEYGTEKMGPRPHIRPALERTVERLRAETGAK